MAEDVQPNEQEETDMNDSDAAGAGAARQSTQSDGLRTLTPHLVCADASAAIEFYKQAFGAEEIMRLPMPDGKLGHAMLRIGDSMLMLADEFPQWDSLSPTSLHGSPVTIHLSIPDVDERFALAIEAGASVRMEPADMFWGDRYGVLIDPFGHHWALATHLRDVPLAEMQATVRQMCSEAQQQQQAAQQQAAR
jgi:uncharacterized glyoxalase superfamily protein PhnB